jgi:hypothetical protein
MSFADSPFSSAPFSATEETNAVVELSGFQLNIAENNLTVSGGGSVVTGSEENTIETFLGTVIAESESIVEVTGVSARFNDLARFSYSLDSQTVGFPVLSNTESKTGTTSAYFGSTNNEIQIPQEQDVIQSALSANNQFTIEFWYYVETATFAPRLISVQQNNNISTRQLHIVPFQGKIRVSNQQGTLIDSAGSVSNQTWTHIALTADNGTVKLYIDGVLEGTSTGTTFIDAQSEFNIGGTGPFSSTDGRFHLDGYMDLFRVSNSVRYTTNFTPPTSAFTVDDNTTIIFNFDGPNGSQDFELLQLPYSSTDIVADANVDVTGLSSEFATGTVVAPAAVILTGVSATISLPNITNGLTLSNTYQSLTNLGSITGRNQNIVFQTDSNGILLKSSYTDAEIWWEAGGTTVGAWLGIAKINNAYFIRFRAGSGQNNEQTTGGGTAGTLNSRAVVNLSVSDSSVASYFDDERHIITWAIEIPDATYLAGRLRLWIDGNEVITYDPYNDDGNVLRISGSAQWAGGDSCGYGQGFSTIAGGDDTYDSGATQYQTFTGTSVGSDVFLNAYENQTIIYYPVEVIGNSNVDVTGEVLSTELGTEVVTASALVQPTGIEVSFAEGDAIVTADSNIEVTGVSARFNDLARFSYSLDSETAGFPVLSNTQSKTGTTSAYFGSTSNEIQIPQEQDVIQSALSANNQFTIEFWYYEETETEFPRLISVQQTSSASTRQFGINRLSNNNIEVVNQDGRLIRSSFGSVSIQNWHHIAVTADNGTLELYIDGVLEGTSTGTTFIDAQSEFNIGGTGPYLSTDDRYHLDGYMDLFRVSNSVRYTTNFTPPTSAFTVDDNTTIIFNFDGPNGSQDFELLQLPYSSTDIVADADVDVTGLEINFTEGEVIVIGEEVVDVTGLEINFAEGTATVVVDAIIDVTGLEISSQSGNVDITADADVNVTGQIINFAIGQVTVVDAWQPVDPSANNAFSAVSTGASNSWTEVAA